MRRAFIPRIKHLALGILAVLLIGVVLAGVLPHTTSTQSSTETAVIAQADDTTTRSIPDVVRQVAPSVVTISHSASTGSGVIYRTDGVILTNQHVVDGAKRVTVEFADGRRSPGRIIGTDRETDLALVRVDRQRLPAATFATRLPELGATSVVLGSPMGFEKSVTAGVVSGVHRNLTGSAEQGTPLVDLLQTDAPVSPGNSGGAMADSSGKITGIVDAYIPPQQGAVAIGFAIPAATAVHVAEDLLDDGHAEHAFLGIQPAQLAPDTASRLGVTEKSGVLVYATSEGGPAARAGIREGDVLTRVAGQRLETVEDLHAALRVHHSGDRIAVDYARGHDHHTTHIVLADRPS